MANSCEQILRFTASEYDRHVVAFGIASLEAPGLTHPVHGYLPSIESLTVFPSKVRYSDDGCTLWVYWETRRTGPNCLWCACLSRMFPQATIPLYYLYESDLGSARLIWHDGEFADEEDYFAPEATETIEEVTDRFYGLVERA